MSVFSLSIHGAPSATSHDTNDGTVWVTLFVDQIGVNTGCSIFLRGPDAGHHADAIAKAFNDAHKAEKDYEAAINEVVI